MCSLFRHRDKLFVPIYLNYLYFTDKCHNTSRPVVKICDKKGGDSGEKDKKKLKRNGNKETLTNTKGCVQARGLTASNGPNLESVGLRGLPFKPRPNDTIESLYDYVDIDNKQQQQTSKLSKCNGKQI